MSKPGLRQLLRQFLALHLQHNGFVVLQRYYERHFTPVGKALLLLFLIALSLGMVGTEVLIYMFLCGLGGLWVGVMMLGWFSRPRAVKARLIFPERLQAGETASCRVELHNAGKRPLFHLVSEILLIHPDPSQAPVILYQQQEAFCLAAGETSDFKVAWTPSVRGGWQLKEIQVISRFPLGLFLWRHRLKIQLPVWVYPDPLFWPEQPWQQRVTQQLQTQSQTSVMRGDSLEFQGIRPWLTGDSPRFIHWPSLARTGQLAVREYQESPGHQIALVMPSLGADSSLPGIQAAFERAVSLTAGLALTLNAQTLHHLHLVQIGAALELAEQGSLNTERLLLRLAQADVSLDPELERLWQMLEQVPPTLLILVVPSWTPALEQLRLQCLNRHWPLEVISAQTEQAG